VLLACIWLVVAVAKRRPNAPASFSHSGPVTAELVCVLCSGCSHGARGGRPWEADTSAQQVHCLFAVAPPL
jgi:hypothetical protein